MAKVDFKKSKHVTKTGAPVERKLVWKVFVTEHNLQELKKLSENPALAIGDTVDLEGQVFIKRLSFKAGRAAAKAYDWDYNYDDLEKSTLKSVDTDHLQASQLIGCVCLDEKGTPFFSSIQEVYDSDPAFITALYKLADEVNNFMGKLQTKSLSDTNSSANLLSTESGEPQLKKPSKKSA